MVLDPVGPAPGSPPAILGLQWVSVSGAIRILLIDDDPDLLALVERQLGAEGYQTARARTAAQGLALHAELDPACVVLDLGLPDRPGQEVHGR